MRITLLANMQKMTDTYICIASIIISICNVKTSNSSSKTCGASALHSNYLRICVRSEEPSLESLCSAELQHTNSSPISTCLRSKSAILFRAI